MTKEERRKREEKKRGGENKDGARRLGKDKRYKKRRSRKWIDRTATKQNVEYIYSKVYDIYQNVHS